MPSNIRIQWNAGTACVSECLLKTLACRGLRVGPSKEATLGHVARLKSRGNQRNEEAVQRESLSGQISRGRRGVICADVSAKNFGQALETLENKHLGADIHDLNARTSMTPESARYFGQKNFGVIFRSFFIEIKGRNYTGPMESQICSWFLQIFADFVTQCAAFGYCTLCHRKPQESTP